MTEAELLKRAREGDRQVLQVLLDSCRARVVRFVTAILNDPHEAEDVFQTACEAVTAGLAEFEGRCAFPTWVYQIALNQARRILRDRGRHAKAADPAAIDRARTRGRGVLSSIYRRELSENLERAVQKLPASLQEAFILHYLEGLDFGEISAITGATENALYARAHRARALLRKRLGKVVDSFWTAEEGEKKGAPPR